MNKLLLKSLTLRNFKGIKEFEMVLDGQSVTVLGDNGSGKTTLFDSALWLLFDKDSQNKKDFSIKTLNSAGEELHNLNHEVEGIFLYNGTEISLKKVFNEKWTKKRGSATQEFTGHETNYFIDGVPVKKKEYTQKVENMIDENIFKLLTNPAYFNQSLHWQDRRKTLLEICGDITTAEVVNAHPQLERLIEILGNRTIENHRKIIAARRSEINKELDKIPVRIDEIERNLPELNGSKEDLEKQMESLNDLIDSKNNDIIGIRNGNAIAEKKKAIQEIELELLKIRHEHQVTAGDKVNQLKAKIQEEKSNGGLLLSKIDRLENQKTDYQEMLESFKASVQHYRERWAEIDKEQFHHESDCTCPTCGQELPEEQVQTAREKALAQFNQDKAERLEIVVAQGKSINAKIVDQNEKILKIEKEIEKIQEQVETKKELIERLHKDLSTAESQIVDIVDNPEHIVKMQEKAKLEREIQEIEQQAEGQIFFIQEEINGFKAKRNMIQGELLSFQSVEQSKKRIQELMEQEKELAREFEKLEEELYLCENFVRLKVEMLEDKINSQFKYACFKLFKQNINGGIEETCETLFNGIPYSSGLNNAAKINVGIDIINTLSKYYGFSPFIFIDNAESVVELIESEAQMIRLVVSGEDKKLRIQKDESLVGKG